MEGHPKLGLSKERVARSSREKSPVVSFAEEVFDFDERQYQTVHAGYHLELTIVTLDIHSVCSFFISLVNQNILGIIQMSFELSVKI